MNRLQELDSQPVGRLLWQYSVPAVVGIMVMSVYNLIGRAFIGQGVGPDAIAGLAVTFPVMNVSSAFGVLIGAGASARTSIVLGAGKPREADLILGNSIVMTLVLGVCYLSVLAIFMDPILRLFGASDTSLPYAREYMLYILPGLLMNNMCYSYNNVMRASGYPTKAMLTMVLGAVLSVILCPLFIFGLHWGIKGAAIATDIAMGISAAVVMLHFFDRKSTLHFKRGTFGLRRDVLLPILAIGASPCVVNTAGCVVNAVINNTVYRYGGDSAVAAISIFTAVTQVTISFVIGVCLGMQPIVGYNYGARRFDRLRRAFWLTAAVCSVVSAAGSALCQFAPWLVSRIFTDNAQLLAASDNALRLATWMFWTVGFQIVVTNFLQSIGEAAKAIFMSMTRQVIFLIPLLVVLPRLWGLEGVWLSFPFGDLCAFVVAVAMLHFQMRKIDRMITPTHIKTQEC